MPGNNLLLVWERMGDYHRARWRCLQDSNIFNNVFAADLVAGDDTYKWSNTQESQYYCRLSEKSLDKVGTIGPLKTFLKTILQRKNVMRQR